MSNFNINSCQSSSWKIQSSLQGPVAIFWDIETCDVPSDVCPEDVASNIGMSLLAHPTINGPVTMFSAYGDFSTFSRQLRKGCQRTGVKLVDAPNNAAYKTILVDMFLFALDNRPPSSILLISGDRDFAPALHVLSRRGYTIILVVPSRARLIPSRVGVSSALSNADRWDWYSLACGHGFVPQVCTSVAWFPVECSINESIERSKSYYNRSNFNINSHQSSSWKIQSSLQGPIAIFWGIENCAVPSDVRPEDVAGNIKKGLRAYPVAYRAISGPVTMFSAYGDFSAFSRGLRKGCQRTGVKLVDVPNDAAYKTILVDMFRFALDNPPPSSILLISGDRDFAPALHVLGRRGYTIILVLPSRVGVSSALRNAARFQWGWSRMVRGHIPRIGSKNSKA